ncbi:MAG TPA: hypothetical protein VF911_01565 [Thermoanaerobaculia bacterium]|jgi:hypothetical protein
MPKLYNALFAISSLRDEVHGLCGEVEAADAARFLARLQQLETKALYLIENVETQKRIAQH